MCRLYALCWLSDGVHWLIIKESGEIVATSPCGFPSESDAMLDVQYRV